MEDCARHVWMEAFVLCYFAYFCRCSGSSAVFHIERIAFSNKQWHKLACRRWPATGVGSRSGDAGTTSTRSGNDYYEAKHQSSRGPECLREPSLWDHLWLILT